MQTHGRKTPRIDVRNTETTIKRESAKLKIYDFIFAIAVMLVLAVGPHEIAPGNKMQKYAIVFGVLLAAQFGMYLLFTRLL
jgi:hypothetical protein